MFIVKLFNSPSLPLCLLSLAHMGVTWSNPTPFQHLIYVVTHFNPIIQLYLTLILPFLSGVMCAKMVLIVLKRSNVYNKHFSGYFENKTLLEEDREDEGKDGVSADTNKERKKIFYDLS